MTQNYLTAEQLGIAKQEREGLIKLIGHLRSPAVIHFDEIENHTNGDISGLQPLRVAFDMGIPTATLTPNEYDCGCAACIGGHLSLMMQGVEMLTDQRVLIPADKATRADSYVMKHEDTDHPLSDLFFPPQDEILSGRWGEISPACASNAIENFLLTGEPDWSYAARRADQDDLINS